MVHLVYSSHDMKSFAQAFGYNGQPYRWDSEMRFNYQCELDALFFHLYRINRIDIEYIMESFPIVKRKDEEKWGCYRTRDTILEFYGHMFSDAFTITKMHIT